MLQNQSPFEQSTAQPSSGPATMPASNQSGRFSHDTFHIRRKLLKLVGSSYYVDDLSGNMLLFADQKGFQLREDIRFFTGEDKTQEVIRVGGRRVLDMSASHDVFDSATGAKIGTLRQKRLMSIVRDEWLILDAQEREIGLIQEDNLVLALLRRYVEMAAMVLPQRFTVTAAGQVVGTYVQNRNPFLNKVNADFTADSGRSVDRRLVVAAAILLCSLEHRTKR